MDETVSTFPWHYLLIIVGCCALILVANHFIFRKLNHKIISSDSKQIIPFYDNTAPIDNVITRLTFRQSLDLAKFSDASKESTEDMLTERLKSSLGDSSVVLSNAADILRSGKYYVFAATPQQQLMLRDGTAVLAQHQESGRNLAGIHDAVSGKFVGQLREVPLNRLMGQVASIAILTVGAAHLVAGADIAKRLNRIEAKLDALIAFRQIDQMAKLHRIYNQAKQLLSGQLNDDAYNKLWQLQGELMELRAVWCGELKHKLEQIIDPRMKPQYKLSIIRKNWDNTIFKQLVECEQESFKIRYSLLLEHVIAVSNRELGRFITSLPGELEELSNVSGLFHNKAEYLSGVYPEYSVEPMERAISVTIDGYNELLPDELRIKELEPLKDGEWSYAD